MTRPAMLIGLLALAASGASAEFHSGTVSSTDEGFAYIGKFCYDYTERAPPGGTDGSTMTLSVVLQAGDRQNLPRGLRLYVFDDQASSWPAVYGKSDLACSLKVSKSRNSTGISWDAAGRWTMPIARIHEHVRPRFWYLVIASCRGFEDIDYEVRFTNQGGTWQQEFGVNEQGLATLYIVYFLVYSAALLLQTYAFQKRWSSEYLHPIVKLSSATIILQFVAVFCAVVHYSAFVGNGFGAPVLDAAREVFGIAAKLTFILTMMLIAGGWTISTDAVQNRGFILGVMGFFIGTYALLALWDVTGRDPASTLYLYESVPGMMIVLLDTVCGVMFARMIRATRDEESDDDKRAFYKQLGIGYSVWFFTLPATVLIAFQMHPWNREFLVTTISLTVSSAAYFSLAALLWPSRADKYFRLTTPDVLDDGDDNL